MRRFASSSPGRNDRSRQDRVHLSDVRLRNDRPGAHKEAGFHPLKIIQHATAQREDTREEDKLAACAMGT